MGLDCRLAEKAVISEAMSVRMGSDGHIYMEYFSRTSSRDG